MVILIVYRAMDMGMNRYIFCDLFIKKYINCKKTIFIFFYERICTIILQVILWEKGVLVKRWRWDN